MQKLLLSLLLISSLFIYFGCQDVTPTNPTTGVEKTLHWNVPGDFGSIQDAVDATTDKGTIYVDAGIYAEAITIDGKDIKLLAMGDVTIAPSAPTTHDDAITIFNGKVTIDGFEIDASACFSGIYARALENEPPVNVDILNNVVYGYEKNGITVNGSNAYGDVAGNTTVGSGPVGPGNWAQNGIQFGYGSKGKATNNSVEGHWYTGEDWGATGILIFEANDVLVQNNEINECEVGIAAQSWGWYFPSVDNNMIIQNNLTDCEWGISVSAYSWTGYSGMDATANNNKVTNNVLSTGSGIGMVGIEIYTYDIDPTYSATAYNNKIIYNTITGYLYSIEEDGTTKSKIQANVYE